MPRGDGTGPQGQGARTGGGRGMGQGQGKGRMGGFALGTGGACVCPKCGKTMPHTRGTPCNQVACPACGAIMTRAQ